MQTKIKNETSTKKMNGVNVSQRPRSQSCFVCETNFSSEFSSHVGRNELHLTRVRTDARYAAIDNELLPRERDGSKKHHIGVFSRRSSDISHPSFERTSSNETRWHLTEIPKRSISTRPKNLAEVVFTLSVYAK